MYMMRDSPTQLETVIVTCDLTERGLSDARYCLGFTGNFNVLYIVIIQFNKIIFEVVFELGL